MAGPLWIDSDDALESLLARLPALPLSLDTEADSFHHYRDKVCLVQLSCGEAAALVDPLSGLDPAPIGRVLADPGRRRPIGAGSSPESGSTSAAASPQESCTRQTLS